MSQTREGALTFIFPKSHKHPNCLGRLELLAEFGPIESVLKSGNQGRHIVTDMEIASMIKEMTKVALKRLVGRDKDAVVEEVLPAALEQKNEKHEILGLLDSVKQTSEGQVLDFADLQDRILAKRDKRLTELINSADTERITRLRAVYVHEKTPQYLKNEALSGVKHGPTHLLHTRTFEIMSLDEHQSTYSLTANAIMVRPQVMQGDIWDRSCCLRGTSHPSYVKSL